MSNKVERAERILEIVRRDGSAGVAELAALLDVTTMTIRRDLAELAEEELVRIYHGVAVPNRGKESFAHGYLLSQAESQHVEEKTRIAKMAASMVEPGDVLIIDAGSTAAMTVGFIPKELPVKIICFSLNVLLQSLDRGNSSVILVGGLYHDTSRIFESPESIELLKKYRANKAFISANGVREDLGVTCSNNFEIEIKQAAIQSSLQKILIADSSKFGKITSCFFAALDEFDAVITDSNLPAPIIRSLRDKDIKVEIA